MTSTVRALIKFWLTCLFAAALWGTLMWIGLRAAHGVDHRVPDLSWLAVVLLAIAPMTFWQANRSDYTP